MNSPDTNLKQTTHSSPHCHHHRHCHRHPHPHCHHHHHRLLLHPLAHSSPNDHRQHHHHHHYYVLPHCDLHNPFAQHPNLNFCSNLISPPPPNSQPAFRAPPQYEAAHPSQQAQMFQNDDIQKIEDVEDEEPIFVMTDEWREFFAKSDARRREAKKLAKKQGKK